VAAGTKAPKSMADCRIINVTKAARSPFGLSGIGLSAIIFSFLAVASAR
jgi:succinate-acetate transporter protein